MPEAKPVSVKVKLNTGVKVTVCTWFAPLTVIDPVEGVAANPDANGVNWNVPAGKLAKMIDAIFEDRVNPLQVTFQVVPDAKPDSTKVKL